MDTRYAVLLVCGFLLLSVGVAVIGPVTAVDSAPTTESSDEELGNGVRIDPAVANAEGTTTVIVRLEERPERVRQATTADQQVASLQTHAAESQSAFERFAAGNPYVEIERRFWVTNAMLVTVDTDRIDLERLGTVDHVTEIHDNFEVRAQSGGATAPAPTIERGVSTNYPSPTIGSEATAQSGAAYTYGLETIGVPEAWSTFENRGDGARVAVLDTGVNDSHPDINVSLWKDFDSSPSTVPTDYGNHGTHVSGTVAGGNYSGTAIGVAPGVELMHGAVLTDCGSNGCSGSADQLFAGMEWAIENDADVISMSLGVQGYIPSFIDAVRNAENAGTLVVAASGNDGDGTSGSPGNVYESFAVGATDANDNVAGFSSGERIVTEDAWGDSAPSDWPGDYVVPDVTAPGDDVYSAVPGGYAEFDGTSMATPHVSGAVALLLSNTDADLSPAEIRELFESTAVDVGDAEHRQGKGRIDVYGAMLAHSRNTVDPTFTPVNTTVSASTTITVDVDHPVESYHWTFEDGTTRTTTEPAVEHTFGDVGPRTVHVTLEDARGETTVTTEIDVLDDVAPTAVLEVPAEITTATNATFDATNSEDNHEIDRYEWDFGDGTTRTTANPIVEHGFDETGAYTVELTVVDPSGNTNATTATVTVRDPPTVTIDSPDDGTAFAHRNVTLEYALDNTDLLDATTLEYRVLDENGDPATDWTGAPFNATPDRETFTVATGDLADGTYTVAFRLLDGDGDPLDVETASDELSLTVKATPPALTLDSRPADDAYGTIGQHNPAVIDVSTLDPRHESTVVTITDSDGTTVAEWDRSNETGGGETVTLEWNATNQTGVSTPEPVEPGEYRITATATDDLGTVEEQTTSVDVDTTTPNVSVTSIDGASADAGIVYANDTQTLTLTLDADDGQPSQGAIDDLSVVLRSETTTYRHPVSVEQASEHTWTANLSLSELPDEGRYQVVATAIDAAKNTNETVAAASIDYDRTAPRLNTVVTDLDGTTVDVRVRSSEPLTDDPQVTVTDAAGNETSIETLTGDGGSNTVWTGAIDVGEDGSYDLTGTGTDLAGNRGTDTTTTTVQSSLHTTNRTVTVLNERTGTFVTVNTSEDVDETFVTLSETPTAPHPLGPESLEVDFLTTELGDDLYANLTDATIGLPVERDRLPDGVEPDDDRVKLRWYNETAGTWEQRDLELREKNEERDGHTIEGEYWTATVETFSTYGVMVDDTEPPELVTSTPGDGATLDAATEIATIDLEYADDISGVDTSSVELRIDGETLTDDEHTQITSSRVVHEGVAVSAGESYEIRLEVADEAGNAAVFETSFEVALEESDDGGGSGGGGGGAPSGGGGGMPQGGTDDGPDHPAPTASITIAPDPALVGEDVTLSGTDSTDESWDIISYEWEVDGESFEGDTVTTSFDEAGEYTVELTVRNAVGENDTATETLTVEAGEKLPDTDDGAGQDPVDDDVTDGEPAADGDDADDADDDDNGGDDEGDDGLPGFGVTVAVVALLSVAILGRRRQH